MQPAVKHREDGLTMYTGKIIDFGDKPSMEAFAAAIRGNGFEAKVGKNRTFWYVLVKNSDVAEIKHLIGRGIYAPWRK
jgi:hypothetical protein